jgi:hypothetical protein
MILRRRIMARKLKKKGAVGNIRHFMRMWKKYRYWVELMPDPYPGVEQYAQEVYGTRWDFPGAQNRNNSRPLYSKYESWGNIIDCPVFGCRSEKLAILVNGRFGKDGI